jgi:hypothetical protein
MTIVTIKPPRTHAFEDLKDKVLDIVGVASLFGLDRLDRASFGYDANHLSGEGPRRCFLAQFRR